MSDQMLERQIAEKIMGWSIVKAGGDDWADKAVENGATYPMWHWWPEGGTGLFRSDDQINHEVWAPTLDLVAAWEVVEEMRRSGWRMRIEYFSGPDLSPPI